MAAVSGFAHARPAVEENALCLMGPLPTSHLFNRK
jgi:hypothetical protein